MAPLAPLLADAAVVKVFHGADYDVTTLKRDFGFRMAGLFDTMLAARMLGMTEIGLQAVLRNELGVTLSKDAQLDDWSRRPLTPRQESYALADVEHLLALHARLVEKLRELDRLDWVLEESAAVTALEPAARERDLDGWQRLKGIRRLSRRELAVAREVWSLREDIAESTDIPAFKLLSTEAILEIAAKKPVDRRGVDAIRGISPRLRERSAEITAAVARGVAVPEADLPRLPTGVRPPRPDEATQQRVQRLRDWRTREALRLKLDVSVVLPQRLLDKVAETAPRTVSDLDRIEGIRQWRIRAFGEGMLSALSAP
jgi:ribonuclease D